MRRRRIRGFVLLPAAALLLGIGTLIRGCSPGIDETDYAAVAEDFLLRNAIIARKIGKVESLEHFGDGGGTGSVSYDVYRLSGTEKTATCSLVLRREGSVWRVSSAMLTIDGLEYRIPVRKTDPERRTPR